MQVRIYNQNIWGNMGGTQCIGNRNALVSAMLREFDADICGFQECNFNTSRAPGVDIAALLSDTYEEVPTSAGEKNFTPVFYKRARFDLIDHGWHRFSGKNDIDSKSFTWCVLQDRATGGRIAYASVHFWWMNKSEEDNLQRLQNVEELNAVLRELQKTYNVPVLFAGDLNCGENCIQGESPILKLSDLGYMRLADVAKESIGRYTSHDYPIRGENDVYLGTNLPYYTLDHAFMLPDDRTTVEHFRVNTTSAALSSSDHCPLEFVVTVQ